MVEQATHNRQATGSNPVGARFYEGCACVSQYALKVNETVDSKNISTLFSNSKLTESNSYHGYCSDNMHKTSDYMPDGRKIIYYTFTQYPVINLKDTDNQSSECLSKENS